MNTKRYSTEFKSLILDLYNEGRPSNSLFSCSNCPGLDQKNKIVRTDVKGESVTLAEFNALQKVVARLKKE